MDNTDQKLMKEEESIKSEKAINRQINYIILESLWRYLNKDAPKQELYDLLGLTKNAYSIIRTGKPKDRYTNLAKRADWKQEYDTGEESSDSAKGHLLRLGLSKEVMTGEELIEVNGITREDWENYIRLRYETGSDTSERQKTIRDMRRKMYRAFSKLQVEKKNRKPIDIAYFYFKCGYAPSDNIKDAELRELQELLKKIKPEMIRVCDSELRKALFDEMKEKCQWLDIMLQYEKEFIVK